MNLDTTNHLENIRKAAANLDGVQRFFQLGDGKSSFY